jgi:hypothetical protein
MSKLVIFCFLLISFSNHSQRFLKQADSLHKNRLLFTSISQASIWTGSFLALQKVWYDDYEKTKFTFFNDANNWMQMDKVGHAYSAYHFSELSAKQFIWSGMSRKKAAIIGASVAFAYQFSIEMLDAYSKNWGFSIPDVISNAFGNLLFLGQELVFKDQPIKFKFSFYQSSFAKYRPEVLGRTFSEQILKDYNGQIYWLTFSPFTFTKHEKWKFLSLALGYSSHAKLVGDNDFYFDIKNKYRI